MATRPSTGHQVDPHGLRAGEAGRLLAGAGWRRFVVLGDGGATVARRGVRGGALTSWTERVAGTLRAVRPDLAHLNLAKRGVVVAQVRSQQLAAALDFTCDLAAVFCGTDDVRRRSFDADAFEMELSRIVAPLRDVGCEVLTVSPFDVTRTDVVPVEERNRLRDRLRLLVERTAVVSLRHGALHVDLAGHPAGAEADVYDGDGRQWSGRGHAVAAAEVVRRLGAHVTLGRRSH
ncbi:hypothetical protein AQ490_11515 [Wenjunlia vitaminophila]|uniref:SGNH hydrolase-type esterase domain-containing protein n=1 Tax=Wenjunlia vitaminophila TaxID=76728 RepID=A0A0T6LKV0_WENVI|nr:GDSL-type esterase/lipase family protein [Wenjunlia vitaminophila]KRV46513.1 hypothetical protein AQ490_11515 [Wenjunlia vitaminophila]